MARFNAMTESFEEVEILGNPALFTCIRIDRATVPAGYQLYEVRYKEDRQGDVVQIARNIMVNRWGSLITREEIWMSTDRCRSIDPAELSYCEGEYLSMKEFMAKYPSLVKPPKDKNRGDAR